MSEALNEPGHPLHKGHIHGERDPETMMMDLSFEAEGRKFTYRHLPFDPKRLRSEEGYRRSYSLQLADEAAALDPDLIFLSNFKTVLDKVFTERFAGRIINVHPSVLPLLKGYKPEWEAAVNGRLPEALGYTFHLVTPDLDGGPTIAQQIVPAVKYSDDNSTYELNRLAVMRAQALHVGRIFALLGREVEQRIVCDAEAFRHEGRPGFECTPQFEESLKADYHHWRSRRPGDERDFDNWRESLRMPYQRLLFKVGDDFQTAESILRIAPQADLDPGLEKQVTAAFYIAPSANRNPTQVFLEITRAIESGDRRRSGISQVMLEPAPHAPPGHFFCVVKGTCGASLTAVLENIPEVHGVELRMLPVSASAPREGPRALL